MRLRITECLNFHLQIFDAIFCYFFVCFEICIKLEKRFFELIGFSLLIHWDISQVITMMQLAIRSVSKTIMETQPVLLMMRQIGSQEYHTKHFTFSNHIQDRENPTNSKNRFSNLMQISKHTKK